MNPSQLNPYFNKTIFFFSSLKFEQALSVFEIMMEKEIPRTLNTYTALISCAEKTGHWEDALRLMVAFPLYFL
jgi:hypothetical protein